MDFTKKLLFAAGFTAMLVVSNPLFANETTTKITPAETSTLATIAAIDKLEILLGVLAVNKKSSSGVSDYGKMMISMHGDNLTQILQMASGMKVSSFKSGTAEDLTNQTRQAMLKLGSLQGAQFDQAYVAAMISGHEGALKLIDTKLMKTATSEEIKKFVTDTRAVVVEHLDDAKKLQEGMKA